MKKICLLAFALPLLMGAKAQANNINFEHTQLAAALQKAKQLHKLVFVDCYTEWCGPCKGMAANVFTQDTVANFFNKEFVNVKLDMEKGEGIKARETYKVEAYPSFLLLDESGKVVYKFVGGMDANKFLANIHEGISPKNKVAVLSKRYESGDRSADLVRAYIKLKIEMLEKTSAKAIADTFFTRLKPSERVLPENWFLFGENRYSLYLSNIYSVNFNYLADNWKAFAVKNNKDTVEAKLRSSYLKIAGYCLRGWYFKEQPYDKAIFDRYKKQLASTELSDKKDLLVLMDVADAIGRKDTSQTVNLLANNFASFTPANKRIIFDFVALIRDRKQFFEMHPLANNIFEIATNTSSDAGVVSVAKMYIKPKN